MYKRQVQTAGTPAATSITDTAFAGCTPTSLGTSGVALNYTSGSTATITSTSATPSGSYTICLVATNGFGANADQKFTLTVDVAPTITSASSTTFVDPTVGSFSVTTTSNPTVTSISNAAFSGCVPTSLSGTGVSFSYTFGANATIASTATATTGTYTLCLLSLIHI